MQSRIAAVVFDAYGTLYDVHSIVAACERQWPQQGAAISRLWRAKQLEWSWQRTVMERYVDFRQITADALRFAAATHGETCADSVVESLLEAYRHLSPFPDACDALEALRPIPCAILSNGSPAMLEPLVRNSGLDRWITQVMSVDALRAYKPAPRVYQLATDRLGVPADAIGFVSANGWDAAGAKACGFRTYWINRMRAPLDAFGEPPDRTLTSLAELPPLLRRDG